MKISVLAQFPELRHIGRKKKTERQICRSVFMAMCHYAWQSGLRLFSYKSASVTVLEFLSASAGTWIVASRQFILYVRSVALLCLVTCVLVCGSLLCLVCQIVLLLGVAL